MILKNRGFDHRKHPVYLEKAIRFAKLNFKETNNIPDLCSTEVFRLAEKIYEFVGAILTSKIADRDREINL